MRQRKNEKNSLMRTAAGIMSGAFAITLAVVLSLGNPFVSHADETDTAPKPGLQVNSYYGYQEDPVAWPQEYESEVFRFLSMVDEDWSDVQKFVFIHDYLVTRCDYNYEGLKDVEKMEGQYGVICDNRGVCSDYSAAFKELAFRLGLQTKSVHSTYMNHEWVVVNINGEWYHVDATWDDSAYTDGDPKFKMYCDHQFLIKSQSGFRHGATDWWMYDEDNGRESAYGIYNDTTFDNTCFSASISPVVVVKDGFLVLQKNGKIQHCDSNGYNETLIATVPDSDMWGTIAAKDDYVFVSNADTIYQLNPSNGNLTKIYTLSDSEKAEYGRIYGIEMEGTSLRYDMAQGPARSNYRTSARLNLESIIGAEIKGYSLNEEALTFYKAGTQYQLKLSDCHGNAVSADSWTSSDPAVATVSGAGNVKAAGYGKTVITALKNGKKYRCVVAFDTTWQNDYDYGVWEGRYKHSDFIYLDHYKKDEPEENIVIPAFAYVGGEYYKTAIRNALFTVYLNGSTRRGTNLFTSNESVLSIALENGVIFEENGYGAFGSCKNLKSFDFGGADLSNALYPDNMLLNCHNLTFVNLSGCRIDSKKDVFNLLNRSNNITHIIAPAYIREGMSIPLTTPLRVKNADGTFGTDRITDLAQVPGGTELVGFDDTTWQEDYEYHFSTVSGRTGRYLCLDKYIGTNENVYVPNLAIVDGKEYPVCLRGAEVTDEGMKTASLFPYSSPVKNFAVEEGVIVDTYYSYWMFRQNSALEEVSFEGCDLSKTKMVIGMFCYCGNLKKVSFKNCSLGAVSNASYFFDGCNRIKEIITPDELADGISIKLPVPMYEKNEDGTTKDTAYTYLEDAPRGCILVSEKKDKPDCVHNLTHVPAKEATCTEDGNSEYWYCDKCDCYYSDEEAENEIEKDSYIIPATGHDYHEVAGSAKEATCTENGKNADQKCSRCNDVIEGTVIDKLGHDWNDGEVTKEPTEQEEGVKTFTCKRCHITRTEPIPKQEHTHNLIHVARVEATCTEAGNSEYWYCDKCKHYFEDADARNEIEKDSYILPALGHDYHEVAGSSKEATCTEDGKEADQKCSRCNNIIDGAIIEAPGHDYHEVADSAKEAACTENGKHADKKCSRCNDIIEGAVIDKLGHNWNNGEVTKEPTEQEEGVKTFTCNRCHETRTETIPKKDHVHNIQHVDAKDAKCEEAGNKEYWYCEGCGLYFSDATAETSVLPESLILASLGHDWDEGVITKKATEEADGVMLYTCKRCSNTRTESIPKLNHSLLHYTEKPATCLENGHIEYWYCKNCDSFFSDKDAQNKIEKNATVTEALGHDYHEVEGTAKKETCGEPGKKADQKCSRCKHVQEGAPIEATGKHTWDEGVVTKEPTFEEEGIKTFTCTVCHATRTENIDKLESKDKVTDLFDDVKEGAWYVSAIQFVYDRGIMTGKGTGFVPDGKLKREEFVQTLYSLSGKPDVPKSTANPFKDVKKEQWFANAILWANSNGYVAGNKDGTFGVGNNIQREAMVSILYKYAAANGYDMSYDAGAITGYADTKKVSGWAKNAFCWAVSKGIISGKGAKGETDKSKIKLDPAGNASRAECAAMLMRLLEMKQ